jgi:hypothetical protein
MNKSKTLMKYFEMIFWPFYITLNSLSKSPEKCFHSDADYFFLKASLKKLLADFNSLLHSSKIYHKIMVLNSSKFHQNQSISPGFFEREFTVLRHVNSRPHNSTKKWFHDKHFCPEIRTNSRILLFKIQINL